MIEPKILVKIRARDYDDARNQAFALENQANLRLSYYETEGFAPDAIFWFEGEVRS